MQYLCYMQIHKTIDEYLWTTGSLMNKGAWRKGLCMVNNGYGEQIMKEKICNRKGKSNVVGKGTH